MRILATDDDPIILELLSQFLIAVGPHEVVTSSSASNSLTLLAQQNSMPFDCFLNDIQMPETDGIELARQIRQIPAYQTTPIVMLTAMSEKRNVDDAFAAGASDYLTKPFDLIEFKSRIGMIEQLVLSRKEPMDNVCADGTSKDYSKLGLRVDLQAPMELSAVDHLIDFRAMENYVAQLSRSSLFGSTVFAFSLRKPAGYYAALSPSEFKSLLKDVAGCISDCLTDHQFLMTYAGNGTYVCITESGWHPDMSALMEAVNLQLNRIEILAHPRLELYPRVSVGVAVRLIWKSGNQILNALNTARHSAENAAVEFERLKTDFFQIGRSA